MSGRPGGLLAAAAVVLGVAFTLITAPSALAATVPLLETGGSGEGAGEHEIPDGIAIDAAGNVYVADRSNSRISVFDPAGDFLRAFGKAVVAGSPPAAGLEVCTTATGCQEGVSSGDPGALSGPSDLAFDTAGHLYVSESSNHRISEYDISTPTPTFVRAFGWDVVPGGLAGLETCTTSCQEGTQGAAAGQLSGPAGLGLDDAGGLYVAQLVSNRIDRFDVSGAAVSFEHAFGAGVDTGVEQFEVCTAASGCESGFLGPEFAGVSGQLRQPQGLALDGSGGLYVADRGLARVSVFDVSAAPTFEHAFGAAVNPMTPGVDFEVCTTACGVGGKGDQAGALALPTDVALDGAGRLAVTNRALLEHRVSVFEVSDLPEFVEAFGWGVDSGAAAFEICTAASGCQAGSSGFGFGQLNAAQGAAFDCRGALWVVNSGADDGRLQRFGEPGTGSSDCRPAPPPPPPPGGGNGGGGGGGAGGRPVVNVREPVTTLGKRPAKQTSSRTARFVFASDQADARFQCKLDRGPFKPCLSPKTYKKLKPGRHVFRVRAVSFLGLTDLTPSGYRWKILGG